MLKKTIIFLLLSIDTIPTTEDRIVTLNDLGLMPRCLEKDYYIWRFLRYRSTTPQQAKIAIKGISHINKKLQIAYRKKTGLNIIKTTPKQKTPTTLFNWHIKSEANRLFDHGIKLITQRKLQAAADEIYKSYYKYTQRWDKDKALFWLYLLTNQKIYLNELKKSYHVNIYTLLAADFTGSKYPKRTVTPNPKRNKSPYVDETDPICWARIKAKLKLPSTNLDRLAQMYDSK
jgi:soluble lytic murein transglycosylase